MNSVLLKQENFGANPGGAQPQHTRFGRGSAVCPPVCPRSPGTDWTSSQTGSSAHAVTLPRTSQGQKAPNCSNANQRARCHLPKSPNGYDRVVRILASLYLGTINAANQQGQEHPLLPARSTGASAGASSSRTRTGPPLRPRGEAFGLRTQEFGWATLLDPVTSGRPIPAGRCSVSMCTVGTPEDPSQADAVPGPLAFHRAVLWGPAGPACPARSAARLHCGLLMRGQRERSSGQEWSLRPSLGQQPPHLGPGQGSATPTGSCPPALCRGLHQGAEDAAWQRSGSCCRCGLRQWLKVRVGFGFLSLTARAGPRPSHGGCLCGRVSCPRGPGPAGGCSHGVYLEEVAKGLSV